MNLIEFESQLAKIGKCFYVFSHGDALRRYFETEPDPEFAERDFGEFFRAREEGEKGELYLLDIKEWATGHTGVRYHCVEVCDACDVLTCTNKNHLHEWGAFGFGRTLQDAFVQVIGEMNRRHKINFAHLATEIPELRNKVRFWNNAWHEQRILTGKNFWMEPYKMESKHED